MIGKKEEEEEEEEEGEELESSCDRLEEKRGRR
jgi:hypothetical protein